jgi:YVTN family beta-propeller protein
MSRPVEWFVLLVLPATAIQAQTNEPLKLEGTIELPSVQGRIDHLSLDDSGQRLFVCALGNDTVEVVDLKTGTRVSTITGVHEPQGVLYVPGRDRLFVASGKDGT